MSHIEIFDSRYARLKAVDWDFTDASQDSLASIHHTPQDLFLIYRESSSQAWDVIKALLFWTRFAEAAQLFSKLSVRVLSLSELI